MTHASDFLIPLADGTRLAASLLLPEGDRPFPLLATFYPYRKDDFIGMQVVTSKGETLGKVEDVVIHPQGRVAYVQVSGGGAAGPARHVPVPWTALTRNEQGQLVLNTT